jgi:hypothetical protein
MKNWNNLILLIATLLVFGNTLSNGYNLDDHLVTNNNVKTSPKTTSNLGTIFSTSYQQEGNVKSGYRPVTIATFYIEHQLFGESARVSHTINLILFCGIVLLIFKVLTLIFNNTNPYILLFTTLLFSLHSIHSEAVASIKNRDELLSLLFFLLSAISAFKWLGKKNLVYLLSTLVFVAFSILSKKSALPLIALFPVLLLFIKKPMVSQFFMTCLAFSIPIGLFAFNFQLFSGLITFAVLILFYLGVFYLPIFWKKTSLAKLTLNEGFILGLIILTALIGTYFNQLVLLITAQLLLLLGFKKHFKLSLFLNIVISILCYLSFYMLEILVYFTMLASAAAMVDKEKIKFNPKVLLGLFPLLFLMAYSKEDYYLILMHLSPIIIFSTIFIHFYIPLVISLIVIAVSFYFNVFSGYQLGILLFGILAISKIKLVKLKKIYAATWICILLLTIGLKYVNLDKTIYFNSIDKLEDYEGQTLKEGRNLEFVENTLVDQHTMGERLATGLVVMGTYLELMVLPRELSFYYGYSKINTTDFKDHKVWISLFSYLLLLYCAIYFFKKQPLISIGAIWFISCILLFSNLPVLVAGMVGERLAFSASLGFCMMIGGVLNWVKPEFSYKKIRGLELLSIFLLLGFSLRTVARNSKWESHVKLMSNDIHHLENSAQANYLLAVHSIKEAEQSAKGGSVDIQKVSASIGYFKRAIEIYPNYYNFHIDLGKAYLVMLQPELAKASFLVADQLDPNALLGLFELAKVSFTLKEYEEVIKHSEGYLKRSKSNPTIYELAAFSAYYVDDYSLALRYTKEGLNLFPANQSFVQLLPDLQRRIFEYNADK